MTVVETLSQKRNYGNDCLCEKVWIKAFGKVIEITKWTSGWFDNEVVCTVLSEPDSFMPEEVRKEFDETL